MQRTLPNYSPVVNLKNPMTLANKGSRQIVVDGDRFRWYIRRKPTYSQALMQTRLTVAIEHFTHPGTTLIVEMQQPHPSHWMNYPVVPVLPSDIERLIRLGIAQGWQPTKVGGSFTITY